MGSQWQLGLCGKTGFRLKNDGAKNIFKNMKINGEIFLRMDDIRYRYPDGSQKTRSYENELT